MEHLHSKFKEFDEKKKREDKKVPTFKMLTLQRAYCVDATLFQLCVSAKMHWLKCKSKNNLF